MDSVVADLLECTEIYLPAGKNSFLQCSKNFSCNLRRNRCIDVFNTGITFTGCLAVNLGFVIYIKYILSNSRKSPLLQSKSPRNLVIKEQNLYKVARNSRNWGQKTQCAQQVHTAYLHIFAYLFAVVDP